MARDAGGVLGATCCCHGDGGRRAAKRKEAGLGHGGMEGRRTT